MVCQFHFNKLRAAGDQVPNRPCILTLNWASLSLAGRAFQFLHCDISWTEGQADADFGDICCTFVAHYSTNTHTL